MNYFHYCGKSKQMPVMMIMIIYFGGFIISKNVILSDMRISIIPMKNSDIVT